MSEVAVTLRKEGRKIDHRGRNGGKRTVTIDREWDVTVDSEVVGKVVYRMFTRERRTGYRTYVDARWESPAYGYQYTPLGHTFEAFSKKHAVEQLVRDYERKQS